MYFPPYAAGNHKYHRDCLKYLEKSEAAIVVYDITDYSSFHQAVEWIAST